jgi:hypothetical protein
MSRHILNLEPGVFCLQTKKGILTDELRRWLGIQILPSPEFSSNVDILSFRSDGWLTDEEDIVLVRVRDEAAALYIIFCHSADEPNSLPHLDVRLLRVLMKKIKTPELALIPDKNPEPTGELDRRFFDRVTNRSRTTGPIIPGATWSRMGITLV